MKKTVRKNSNASLATARAAGGIVRIVGGSYKRTPIKVADFVGLRPTPERVRETVFDWIAHLIGGCAGHTFCDMFAGSGALGLEAASRGGDKVVSIDKNRACTKAIAGLVQKLGATSCVQVVCADKSISEADFQALGLSILRQGKAGQVHFFVLKADFP